MASVKTRRPYDSRARLEQARRTQETILDVARESFLAAGYGATTVTAIAGKAGVSAETIYKTFGGKAGLVRAIYERGLAGRGPTAAPERSDAVSARESDPRAIIRHWGMLHAEVTPLVAPILLLARSAAALDSDLAAMLKDSDESRLARMRHNAGMLAKRGFLREGVTVQHAADILWFHTAPELYELLVLRRGWTPAKLGDFVAATLIAALL
jgi:AcrR family transcriptional regulator